jgi:ribonuclease HII
MFDVRFVAGADEAGRGSLAGPLVVAAVLFDYAALRGSRVRSLAKLNDSKQVSVQDREELFEAVGASASAISIRIVPVGAIDRNGLHRSNLAGLRAVLADLHPPAEECLVDGFRLGPAAPPHRAVINGDARSAVIAAASIVAKVMRDRVMRRLDALHPNYGFVSHMGYITPAHSRAVRALGPSELHRRSFQAACYRGTPGGFGAAPVGHVDHLDRESSAKPERLAPALPVSFSRVDESDAAGEARAATASAA